MLSRDKSVEAAKFKPVGLKPANVLNVVNTVKSVKKAESKVYINSLQVTLVNAVHPLKQLLPKLVTPLEIVTLANAVQF